MKDIFVGDLDDETSEDELRELFAAYGPVDRVSIVTDRYSGQPRGFAFVEMASAGDADKAITELNGAQLHGRPHITHKKHWSGSIATSEEGKRPHPRKFFNFLSHWLLLYPLQHFASRLAVRAFS